MSHARVYARHGDIREHPRAPAAPDIAKARKRALGSSGLRRRRYAQLLGHREQPRPRPLRQRNAVAQALLQDAVAALARQVDALGAAVLRQRVEEIAEAIGPRADFVDIAEGREIDGDGNTVE